MQKKQKNKPVETPATKEPRTVSVANAEKEEEKTSMKNERDEKSASLDLECKTNPTNASSREAAESSAIITQEPESEQKAQAKIRSDATPEEEKTSSSALRPQKPSSVSPEAAPEETKLLTPKKSVFKKKKKIKIIIHCFLFFFWAVVITKNNIYIK